MPIRVAVIDSGVTLGHAHVGEIAGGVSIGVYQNSPEFSDLLGHGTAVCGAIRMHCSDCELLAVRVFERVLGAPAKVVLRALDWCLDSQNVRLINLSLGTARADLFGEFRERVDRAARAGALIVSPYDHLPGTIEGVVGVGSDVGAAFGTHRVGHRGGRDVVFATPHARPIPGVPLDYNYQGASFACGHVTGLLAARWTRDPSMTSVDLLARFLSEGEREAVGDDRAQL